MALEPFAFTAEQLARLWERRAMWEEGEGEERLERLRQREEDLEAVRAFSSLLVETRFAEGGNLSFAQTSQLLALARSLVANPNLDSRLLRQPDEPAQFCEDLRFLLFGEASLPSRLRVFIARRRMGGQTAFQLLACAFPTLYPLLSKATWERLSLSPVQERKALAEARERYDLPEDAEPSLPDSDPVLRLLSQKGVYEAAKMALETEDYFVLNRLLSASERRRRAKPMLYSLPSFIAPHTTYVRESPSVAYQVGSPPISPDIASVSTRQLLEAVEGYVEAKGFCYPPHTLRSYFVSLQSKPFCLLAGVSGTGKTRLTSLFAEALAGEGAGNTLLLPVRSDWTDSTPLLGYVNLLARSESGTGRFVPTPFTEFLARANAPQNRYRAFFLCLDEMNLARAEHYFAEVLSAMETPSREMLLPDGTRTRLPENLFIVGTMNLDEATHPLSRKTLDRANAFVFSEADFSSYQKASNRVEYVAPEIAQAIFLLRRAQNVGEAMERLKALGTASRVVETLSEANRILQPYGLGFAYRLRDEALRFCANSYGDTGLFDADTNTNLRIALDLQLCQKVVPRFSGSQAQLEVPLQALWEWASSHAFSMTARRLERLEICLQRDGFLHFDTP